MTSYLNELKQQAGVHGLLSKHGSNPKITKSDKLGILTTVLHLAPGNMSGHEVCPKRSAGCTAACLHFAGSPAYMTTKTQSRITKTKLFFADRNLFMNILAMEIGKAIVTAAKQNMTPAFRLNGTSDIVWEKKKFILYPKTLEFLYKLGVDLDRDAHDIISLFPSTTFYDYTKVSNRTPPSNYDLTFSLSEQNMNEAVKELESGKNIAAVFFNSLPTTMLIGCHKIAIIDGDQHDYRPSDPRKVIVGLKAKGIKGRADGTGFVQVLPGKLLAA